MRSRFRFAMPLLSSHVLRAMLAVRMRLMFIALICAATFGVQVGARSAIDSLFNTVETLQADADMADLELLIAPEDLNNMPDLASMPGVIQVEHRLLSSGRLELDGLSVSALHIGADLDQLTRINRLTLLEGKLPRADDPSGVALERNCAATHRKRPGDRLALRIGSANYAMLVRAVVQSPEYLITPLNPSVYVPASGSHCVMFGSSRILHDALGFAVFNSVLIRFAPGQLSAQREATLARAQTRLSIDYALSRADQFSQKALELNLNMFRVFLPALVAMLALSSVCVVHFLIVRWIQSERSRIAMLLTLGYSQGQLAAAYMLPALVLFMMTMVLGWPVAWFNLWSFGKHYAAAIGMPEPVLRLQMEHVVGAALLTAVTIGLACWLPVREIMSIQPTETLRELPSIKNQKARNAGVAPWVRGPFWFRYAVRNLWRNWPVTQLSLAMTGLSLAVSISYHISLSSIGNSALETFVGDRWAAVVDLDRPQWDENLAMLERALPGSRWLPFVRGGAHVVGASRIDLAYLVGIEPDSGTRQVQLLEGRQLLAADRDVAVIERRLANEQKVGVGQKVILRVHGELHPITVVGIHSSAIPGEIVLPRRTAQGLLGLDEQFTGAFLLAPLPDADAIARLLALPAVLRVTKKSDVGQAITEYNRHVWILVRLAAVTSIVVCALFLLASTTFTIASRQAEYGMLRLLGHGNGTIARIVCTEILLQILGAALLAILLAPWLARILNGRLAAVWFNVSTQACWADFTPVLVPAILFVPSVALPVLHELLRTPLDQVLKERKLG